MIVRLNLESHNVPDESKDMTIGIKVVCLNLTMRI